MELLSDLTKRSSEEFRKSHVWGYLRCDDGKMHGSVGESDEGDGSSVKVSQSRNYPDSPSPTAKAGTTNPRNRFPLVPDMIFVFPTLRPVFPFQTLSFFPMIQNLSHCYSTRPNISA